MKARMVSLMILTATMSLPAGAGAQDEPPPGTEESGPPDYPPPDYQQPPAPGQTGPAPAAPAAAAAASPTDVGLGTVGQFVVSDDVQVTLLRQSLSQGGQTRDVTGIQLQPAFDYFVSPNLSIGGQVRILYASVDNGAGSTDDTTTLGLLPRIGYNVALSPGASIWPRVALGYVHTSGSSFNGQVTSSSYTVSLEVFVPLIFQPVPHFFLGGGPLVSTDLVSKLDSNDGVKTTNIGLQSTIGGYFGL
jgi:hypothetical protein